MSRNMKYETYVTKYETFSLYVEIKNEKTTMTRECKFLVKSHYRSKRKDVANFVLVKLRVL